ncbi:hypothetical protein DFH28DRAFT_909292 [Melampsora americana]|nr:hypothetical protein DFH28DRAFT_909292 [Melampsora americana]
MGPRWAANSRGLFLIIFFLTTAHTIQPVVFCSCQPDQVRLIFMGYIRGSPVQPEMVFSLRLLRLHNIIWKFCCVQTHPFAQALDDFH